MCPGAGVEVADDLRQQEGQGIAPALSFWASSKRGDASGDSGKPDVEPGLCVGCGADRVARFYGGDRLSGLAADLHGHDGGGLVDVESRESAGVSCVGCGCLAVGTVIHFLPHTADGGADGVGLVLAVVGVGVEGYLLFGLVRREAEPETGRGL